MTIVKEFPKRQPGMSGAGSKYDKYLDGQIHRVVPGIDVRVKQTALSSAIRQRAMKRKLKVHIETHKEIIGKSQHPRPVLYIQARVPVESTQKFEANVSLDGVDKPVEVV